MTKFKNTKEFAIALHGDDDALRLLPYNRYQSDNTEWWILPKGTENPAYKYGKFFVEDTTFSGKYFCGFCFEKGYEQKEICDSNPNEEMQSDWDWHKFVKQINNKDDDLRNIFLKIAKHELPCNINISYGMCDESINFNLQLTKSLNFTSVELGHNTDKENSIFDIMNIIEKNVGSDKMSWTWIDLKIGVVIEKDEDVNELDIWSNYLEPWQKWWELDK